MIKYKTEMAEHQSPESIVCDICKKEYSYKGNDSMEAQEFHYIRFQGGFSSVFGDGAKMKLDMCQHCLKKILGEYLIEDESDEVL